MASQKSTDEILEILETLDHQELREKAEELLPQLISSLNVEDESCKGIKIVQVLVQSFLPVFKIQDAEKEILQYALPALRSLFREALNAIHCKLLGEEHTDQNEVVDSVDGLLKVSLILLECVGNTLQYVISNKPINANEVPSLSKNVADVLLDSFKHCKESSDLYGEIFQILSEDLSMLFKKSHAVQGQFISALSSNIKFNCSYEEDLVNLIEVLEVMEEIAEIVTGLDIKTMANQWKFYAKAMQENAEHLKQRIDISRPINFMSGDIVNGLKSLLQLDLSDSKNVVRTLKLMNFNLKILMLFCELYNGYLGDCHGALLNLMMYILSNSYPWLQVIQVPATVIADVESYVTVGIEPLVSRLMEEKDLANEFFKFANFLEKEENLKLGFLLLSVMLMKNNLRCENIRRLWLQKDPNSNLIAVVFRSLGHCDLELMQDFKIKGSCKGPTVGRSGATHGLYESLLIHTSALITTIPAEDMSIVELTLLENILSRNGNIWQALMATDVWCMVVRCGTAEFCYKHLCQLSNLTMQMLQDRSCPETCYLKVLLHRLFSLLSNKGMVQLSEKFPPVSHPRLWHVFGLKRLPEHLRMKLKLELINKATLEVNKFISSPLSINLYEKVMDAVVGASAAFECLPKETRQESAQLFSSKLMDVWASISDSRCLQRNITSLKWLDKFFYDLTTATISLTPVLSNTHILQVLDVFLEEEFQGLYSVNFASINFLRSLAVISFAIDGYQDLVCERVAKAFSLLLKNKNELIQQLSLKTFTYFSKVTQHEQIVSLSVSGSQEVKELVANYLKKVPWGTVPGNQFSFNDYLIKQSNIQPSHHCDSNRRNLSLVHSPQSSMSPQIIKEKCEQDDKPISEDGFLFKYGDNSISNITVGTEIDFKSKKRKMDDDICVVVKRMKDDVNYIKEHYIKILPHDIKAEIQEMVNELNSLVG